MKARYRVVYDGEVLRPQGPIDLELNKEYTVTLDEGEGHRSEFVAQAEMSDIFAFVLEHAEDLEIEDLAEQHDHYLYNTPKR